MRYGVIAPLILAIAFGTGGAIYCGFTVKPEDGDTLAISLTQMILWAAVGLAVGVLGVAAAAPRFRFTTRSVLLATFWIALCCAAWRWRGITIQNNRQLAFYFAVLSFRYFPIPTAIGTLFGRAWLGFAIGIGLYSLLLGLGLILLYNNLVAV